jgi:hypothetical protein
LRVTVVSTVAAAIALLAPALARASWAPSQSLMPNGVTSTSPVQIAYDGAGNAIAFYTKYISFADELYIRERPSGGPWGAPQLVPISPALGSYIRDLTVAENSAGDVVIAFRSWGIHVLRRPAGGSWSAVTSWNSPGSSGPASGCPNAPAVDVGENGTAVVAWSPSNSCNGVVTYWRVLAAAFTPGSGWDATPQVWDTSATDMHSWPGVVVADDGTATVAFGSQTPSFNYEEWTVDRSPAGAWGSPSMLAGVGAGGRDAPVLASRGSVTAIAWPGAATTTAALRSGNAWGPAQSLPFPGYPQGEPQSVTVDGSGTAYVASAVVDGQDRRVHVASHPVAGIWVDTAISPAGENGFSPAVAANGAGDVVLAWGRGVSSNQVGMAALRPAGGGWPATGQQISNTAGSNVAARVAVDEFGHALAVVTPFVNGFNVNGDVILETRDPAAADPGSPPTVSPSSPNAGDTLTCDPGAFLGTPPFRYAYEWYSNDSLISGATASTYETTEDDAGADINCRVTATNEAGSDSADSSAVTINGGTGNPCEITQDRSTDAATSYYMTIINDTDATVQIYWLDYNGDRQLYRTLGPAPESWTQLTYLTHPWLILDVETGECVGYTVDQDEYHITHSVPQPADTDGDGLLDSWETNGIDADGDGTVDLALNQPPFNADPNHKDVFLEVDYMAPPASGTLADVVAAFAAAPVFNPDASTGVTLHAMLGETVPTYADICWGCANPPPPPSFQNLKSGGSAPCDGYFGTAAERASANCEAILAARRLVFRYAIFGQAYDGSGSSGVAEVPGNDLLVTVAGKPADWIVAAGGQRPAEAGTLMHELGHTLDLGHGGGDSTNCKPNYQSVMSYSYQVPNFDPFRPLDYSREDLPELVESDLDEKAGIGAGSGSVVFGVNGAVQVVDAGGPVDWNGDTAFDSSVSADINYLLKSDGNVLGDCGPSAGQHLHGHEDWSSLEYNFRLTVGFANGVADPPPPPPPAELKAVDAVKAAEAVDSDHDGITNASESVCDTTRAYVQGSPKYQASKPQQRASADAQVASACSVVAKITRTTKPAQKKDLVASFKTKIDGLRSGGWLTTAQATTLKAMADTL